MPKQIINIDKIILLSLCVYLCFLSVPVDITPIVIASLLAIIASGLISIFDRNLPIVLVLGVYLLLCLFLPKLWILLPLIAYDLAIKGKEAFVSGQLIGIAVGYALVTLLLFDKQTTTAFVLSLTSMVFALLLAYRKHKIQVLEQKMIVQRDSSTELTLLLQEKNKAIMDNQDQEVHMAMLSERNRIAREIHDNVGHMLSRTILQTAALMTIHKEEPLHEQLSSINESLNAAMTSIRESVHNLRDESVDLEQSVTEIIKPLENQFSVKLDYDMSSQVDKDIKYCFINILKEATANIAKHCNGSHVDIVLREQPAFFQLSIEDNGSRKMDSTSDGMGINNMRERVEKLHGIFRVSDDKGFKIFISVPKTESR